LTANREKAVAYRTDHHLTAWGAYTLYTCWSPNPRPASAYTVRSFEGFCGTTWSSSGYWLVPPDTLEVWDDGGDYTVTIRESGSDTVTHAGLFFEEHLAALDAYPVYLDGNHPLTVIENAAAPGGTLLVVKDSYAHAFATLAAGDYRRIVLVDLRYYRAPVSALAERYEATELLFLYGLDNLLTDTNSAWLT
ncbi:MAG: DHHW family protein, partial [bacterium]